MTVRVTAHLDADEYSAGSLVTVYVTLESVCENEKEDGDGGNSDNNNNNDGYDNGYGYNNAEKDRLREDEVINDVGLEKRLSELRKAELEEQEKMGIQAETVYVEWCAVQLYGHENHDAALVKPLGPKQQLQKRASTQDENIPGKRRLPKRPSLLIRRGSTKGFPGKYTRMPDVSALCGPSGSCLFASPLEVLGCMLPFPRQKDTTMVFRCSLRLPKLLPPSFKGTSTSYWYQLTVCTKVSGLEHVSLLNVPVAITGLQEMWKSARRLAALEIESNGDDNADDVASSADENVEDALNALSSSQEDPDLPRIVFPRASESHDFEVFSCPVDAEETEGSNGGLCPQKPLVLHDFDLCGMARRAKQYEATCAVVEMQKKLAEKVLRRGGSSYGSQYLEKLVSVETDVKMYNISMGSALVASMAMYFPSTSPGMDALFTFDFSASTVRCRHISCSLETEESPVGPKPLMSALVPLSRGHEGTGPWWHRLSTRSVYVAPNATSLSMIVHVPHSVTADFATDIVQVKSYFCFTFATTSKEGEEDEEGELQVLKWRIPAKVAPLSRDDDDVSTLAADGGFGHSGRGGHFRAVESGNGVASLQRSPVVRGPRSRLAYLGL